MLDTPLAVARILVIGEPAVAGRVHDAVPGWVVTGAFDRRRGLSPARPDDSSWDVIVVEVPPTDESLAIPLRVRSEAPDVPVLPMVHASEMSQLLCELGCFPALHVTASPEQLAWALRRASAWRPPPLRSDPLMAYAQRLAWASGSRTPPAHLRVAVLASSDILRIGMREFVAAAGGVVSLDTRFPEILRNNLVAGDHPPTIVADSTMCCIACELAQEFRLPALIVALTASAGYRALDRARGVVVEPIQVNTLAAALRAVAGGERYRDRRLEHPFDGAPLTKTERRIAGMILQEKRPDAIVRELTLRPVTLRWHVSNIYAKLGVDSAEGIRAWVDRRG